MSVKVFCRTNLDLERERWPDQLPFRPNVGDSIESQTAWQGIRHLRLKVVAVTFTFRDIDREYWYAEVELHLPDHFKTISEFETWYGKLTGSPLHT